MHPLAFYQKRTHLCVLAVGRAMFAHVPDMTPARFDILYVIYSQRMKWMPYAKEQWCITRALGLSRQTVWRGLRRLAALGWVKIRKAHYPKNHNVVEMTDEGIGRMRGALDAAFSTRKPLPRDAPVADPPRYWKRPELADEDLASTGAKVAGREVASRYSKWIWQETPGRGKTGRRGKRDRYLNVFDHMLDHARAVANLFGNRTFSIYNFRFMEESDH